MSVGSGYGKFKADEPVPGKKRRNSDHGPDFRLIYRVLKINRLTIFSVVLLSAALAFFQHGSKVLYYIATAKLVVQQKEKINPISVLEGATQADGFATKAPTLMELFQTREACAEVADELLKSAPNVALRLMAHEKDFSLENAKQPENVVKIAGAACGTVWFQPDFDKLMLQVNSRSFDPVVSATIANVVAKKLIDFDRRTMIRKLADLKKFLSQQESDLGAKLSELESERAAFQSATNLISVGNAQNQFYDNKGRTDQMFSDTEMRLKSNERLIASTQKTLEQVKELLTNGDSGSNLYLSQIQYRLNMLQYRKAMLGDRQTEEGKGIEAEIQEITLAYKTALDSKSPGGSTGVYYANPLDYFRSLQNTLKVLQKDNQELRLTLDSVGATIKKRSFDTQQLTKNIQKLGEIERSIETTSGLYVVIKKRLQETEIEEAATASDFQLLREATPPGGTENIPLTKKLLFTLGIGLFGIIALILVRETMLPTVRSLSDLEREGLTAVGHIPIVETSPFLPPPLLLNDSPNSFEADSFRALRVRVSSLADYLVKNKNGAKVIMVTSPRPYCGKTFISCNLALAFAKAGKKTLLFDLDLRRPSGKDYFPSIVSNGFEELAKHHDVKKVVKPFAENLDVLLNAQPSDSPAELLEQIQLHKIIESERSKYDYIILDMPPTLAVIDPFMVINQADLVLLIAEHRKTHKEDLSHSVRMLTEINDTPIIGLLNMVHPEMISADGSRYYIVVSNPRDRKKEPAAS